MSDNRLSDCGVTIRTMQASVQPYEPSSLSFDTLRRRLRDLAGDERRIQVEFLVHLAEFDERRGYAEAGYDSLWSYCLRELHLRESAAARRIAAMRALRQHPGLAAPLRDGRLCMSTVRLIAPLLADLPLDDVVSRAAYLTKTEVENLVASLRPSSAPRDGVRRLHRPDCAELEATGATPHVASGSSSIASATDPAPPIADTPHPTDSAVAAGAPCESRDARNALSLQPPRAAAEMRPVAADTWSLRVTIDAAMKADLEMLTNLLSHTSRGDLTAVLREALRCGVEKHGKRRGAIAPDRPRRPRASDAPASTPPTGMRSTGGGDSSSSPSDDSASSLSDDSSSSPSDDSASTPSGVPCSSPTGGAEAEPKGARAVENVAPPPGADHRAGRRNSRASSPAIPAAVRREVWRRDGGCCAWVTPDGRRCRSRWNLQVDHIEPAALGGPPTPENLRVLCRAHNLLHAEQVFGRAHMERFRSRAPGPPGARSVPAGELSCAPARPSASPATPQDRETSARSPRPFPLDAAVGRISLSEPLDDVSSEEHSVIAAEAIRQRLWIPG